MNSDDGALADSILRKIVTEAKWSGFLMVDTDGPIPVCCIEASLIDLTQDEATYLNRLKGKDE